MPGSAVTVDGYASGDDPANAFAVTLSRARARLIADLLVEMGIPRTAISVVGHGNKQQPHPDSPTSPLNRVVVITSTVK
jgi:outer membrane protein OmpA-like peptidoglycan-associated protein